MGSHDYRQHLSVFAGGFFDGEPDEVEIGAIDRDLSRNDPDAVAVMQLRALTSIAQSLAVIASAVERYEPVLRAITDRLGTGGADDK